MQSRSDKLIFVKRKCILHSHPVKSRHHSGSVQPDQIFCVSMALVPKPDLGCRVAELQVEGSVYGFSTLRMKQVNGSG